MFNEKQTELIEKNLVEQGLIEEGKYISLTDKGLEQIEIFSKNNPELFYLHFLSIIQFIKEENVKL